MKTNTGNIDRALRAIFGLILLSLVFVGPQTMWGLIGIIPLVTAIIGICPAYSLLGINTCKTPQK
ncbi:MAG TPA: DUF2892 domain-containing protein [Gammaproteobacteria bacterium]